jgi:hypothetical protein
MAQQFIKTTIEQEIVQTDINGLAIFTKKINLKEGFRHRLVQTDLFQDALPLVTAAGENRPIVEVVLSPYQVIPTEMRLQVNTPPLTNRYPSAGNDLVLFKAVGEQTRNRFIEFQQFPSPQIASLQYDAFYTNHVYVNVAFHGEASTQYQNLALSFYMMLDNKKVDSVEAGIGIMREVQEGMCVEMASNGLLVSKATLKGNTFPMWRYGGIRPERMLTSTKEGGFFLPMSNRDEEEMQSTGTIRSMVASARSMSGFNEAFGEDTAGFGQIPDWLRLNLSEGLVSGAIRDQWPPTKYTDTGNLRML